MNPLLSLLIRNALLSLATYLASKGYLAPDKVDAWVSSNTELFLGFAGISLALAWSFFDKLRNSIFHLNGAPKSISKVQDRIFDVAAKKQ